ncbi:MAG: ABC transporter ATP-binding protein [Chloroflexota bacterium]|jgi:ABC-type polysaccharide/polyol phosphate transport system ATPase subunit
MSSETAILLIDVSKRFKFSTDEAESILDVIISGMRRKSRRHEQVLWAVRDVNILVQSGESIALVGLNGSGKSTILKLAAGIIRPSDGRVEIRGRLSALLELGAGFHPDLTGEENIWLNASILGLTNAEIAAIHDDIVAFSELGDFINMPVKHYSSGMYMRLGFSVAVHISPDILLIDEILAVGDQSFQDKCIERLRKLKAEGTTVVFVSHNPTTVLALCDRALWIEHGRVVADGPAPQVVADYLASQGTASTLPAGPLSKDVELVGLRLYDAQGNVGDTFKMGQEMTIEVDYLARRPVAKVEFDVSFRHEDGAFVGGPTGMQNDAAFGVSAGPGTIRCHIDSLPLSPGVYHISASVFDGEGQTVFDHRERLGTFRLVDETSGRRGGLVRIPAKWESVPRPVDSQSQPPGSIVDRGDGLATGEVTSRT